MRLKSAVLWPALTLTALLTFADHPAPASEQYPRYTTPLGEPLPEALPLDRYRERRLPLPPFLPFAPSRGTVAGIDADDLNSGRFSTEVARLVAAGIEYIRVDLAWPDVQAGIGAPFDSTFTSRIVRDVVSAGGKIIAILDYTPSGFAVERAPCDGVDFVKDISDKKPPQPQYYPAWADYVDRIATWYGDRVDYYEIWNEEDWDWFFYGTTDEYRGLLTAADSVLQLRDPTAKVILGGLAFPRWVGPLWVEHLLDEEVYESVDIFGVHGYAAQQHHALEMLEQAWELKGWNDGLHPRKEIWVTETGYPAWTLPTGDLLVRRAHPYSQVDYVHRTLSRWRSPLVTNVVWFTGWERPLSTNMDLNFTTGLIDSVGNARPALEEWAQWSDPLFAGRAEVRYDPNLSSPYGGLYPVEVALAQDGQAYGGLAFHSLAPLDSIQVGTGYLYTRAFDAAQTQHGLHFDIDDEWMYRHDGPAIIEIEYAGLAGPAPFYIQYDGAVDTTMTAVPYAMEPGHCQPDPELPESYPYDEVTLGDERVLGPLYGPGQGVQRTGFVIDDAVFANRLAMGSDLVVRFGWGDMGSGATTKVHIKSLSIQKAPIAQVLAPAAGAVHFEGDSLLVDWDDTYDDVINAIDLKIYVDGSPSPLVLALDIPNAGSHWWVPGPLHIADEVLVEVGFHNPWNDLVRTARASGPIAIRPSHEEILQPNGGELLLAAQETLISWTDHNTWLVDQGDSTRIFDVVDIFLHRDAGADTDTLALGIQNVGSFAWTPDADMASPECMIEVVFHNALTGGTGSDLSDQSFVVAPDHQEIFANKSLTDPQDPQSDPILDYEGTPYSSVAFDYDGDGRLDLFVTQQDGEGIIYRNQGAPGSGAPIMVPDRLQAFVIGQRPGFGLHGLAVADFDGRWGPDLFVSATPDSGLNRARLYRNDGDGTFTDVTEELVPTGAFAGSWTGAWGDYDEDGWPDLFVGRGTSAPGAPLGTYPRALLHAPPVLLRNRVLDHSLRAFEDVSSYTASAVVKSPGDPGIACVSAAWGDVDGDGLLDLAAGSIYPSLGQPESRLYINQGDGTFEDQWAQRIGYAQGQVSSLELGRLADPAAPVPDLVLGIMDESYNQPIVHFNNGSGSLLQKTNLSTGFRTNSLRLVDHGRDGLLDVLALPDLTTGTNLTPRLFVNYETPSGPSFLEQGSDAGFTETGGGDGITLADFDGDHREDLFLGRRVDTKAFYYRSESSGQDEPGITIRLDGNGGQEASGLGSTVTLLADGVPRQVTTISGGDGRGGQRSPEVVFGVNGLDASVYQARVDWPDGITQTTTVQPGATHTFSYTSDPGLIRATVGVVISIGGPGISEWIFTWQTSYRGDPYLDRVYVTPLGGCGDPEAYTADREDTEVWVTRLANGNYLHRMVVADIPCQLFCNYSYYCQSATGQQVSNHQSQPKAFGVKVCAQ